MAISANGLIAKNDDNTDWISDVEWKSYVEACQKAKAMIIGRRTYEILTKQAGFEELDGVKIVAVTQQENLELVDDIHQTANSPHDALVCLEGFEEVVIAGGAKLNQSFLQENLVDEIYLDVEPVILSEGIPLLAPGDKSLDVSLEFLGQRMIGTQVVQLHYKVNKKP